MLACAPAWADGLVVLTKASKADTYQAARALVPPPRAYPTKDNASLYLVWTPGGEEGVKDWIISLHGANGFATDDLMMWAPHLQGQRVGLISLQWWVGEGDNDPDYLRPDQLYAAMEDALQQVGAKPGQAMLHGEGRGAANIYAVAARDIAGKRWFRMFLPNGGGVDGAYPPNKSIDNGVYGDAPFADSAWMMVCGGQAPTPQRDGCPAMEAAAAWVEGHGGEVAPVLKDEAAERHVLHQNPAFMKAVLDMFLKELAQD